MSNKIESLLRGIGNVQDVVNAVCTDRGTTDQHTSLLARTVCDFETCFAGGESAANAATVVLASILNSRLVHTGMLYTVGDSGEIEREYIISGALRNAILSLIS